MKAHLVAAALLSVLAFPAHAGDKTCNGMICPDHDSGVMRVQQANGMTRSNAAMPDPAMTRTQAYGRGQLRTGYDTQGRYWYDYDGARSRSRPAAPTRAALVGTSPSRTWHSAAGGSIRVDYQHNDTVRLNFADGSNRLLNRSYSASGKRYVSGEYEWSEADGHASYRRNGVPVFDGVQNR